MYLLVYWWLEFSDRLSQNVAVCEMLVQDAKDLVVECLVYPNTLDKLPDGLEEREGGKGGYSEPPIVNPPRRGHNRNHLPIFHLQREQPLYKGQNSCPLFRVIQCTVWCPVDL